MPSGRSVQRRKEVLYLPLRRTCGFAVLLFLKAAIATAEQPPEKREGAMTVAVKARETTIRSARDVRSQRVTDGSLAVELDWAVRRRELEHAGEAPRRREEEQRQVRVKPARKRERLSALTVLGVVAAAFLAFQVLMGCIRLTQLSGETVDLKNTYTTLQTEHNVLRAQYEQTFDLASIKEAAEAAGMVKPGSGRIIYVDLPAEDSATVFHQREMNLFQRAAQAVRLGVETMVDFFT
ncbi:MAG: hypothetical protein IJT94_15865 [Oscillibacter sp.]|nr:hypothetical protein [Oscillibacter sp.]